MEQEHTIQATGWPAITLHGRLLGEDTQQLDARRSVRVRLYQRDDSTSYEGSPFVGTMEYLTNWPIERPFLRVYEANGWDELLEQLRTAATTVLPPGAGYPATEIYRDRQRRLREQMQVIALTALTVALNQGAPEPE